MPPRIHAATITRLALVITGCLLALILTVGWMIRQNIDRTKAAANDIANHVMDSLQVRPRIVVGHRTVVQQQTAVLKLVTVEKTLTERQRIDNSWLHSTKTLEVEADFIIRAGFDFEKPFIIEIDRSGDALRVTTPPAEILGVELSDVRFPIDEDGLWNKLTSEDREAAIRDLRLRVQSSVRQSGLLREAREQGQKKLAALLTSEGHPVVFEPEKSH